MGRAGTPLALGLVLLGQACTVDMGLPSADAGRRGHEFQDGGGGAGPWDSGRPMGDGGPGSLDTGAGGPADDSGVASDSGPPADAGPRGDLGPGPDLAFDAGHDAAQLDLGQEDLGPGGTEDLGRPDAGACGDGLGSWCDPIPIVSFPFEDRRDTMDAPSNDVDSYGCAPGIGEAGPEWVYTFRVEGGQGWFSAWIDEQRGDGVDVDLHLLDGDGHCVQRSNDRVAALLEPGVYLLVADTWSDGAGERYPGPYHLQAGLIYPSRGSCRMRHETIPMYNRENGLELPALGPVVKEAHLVTLDDAFGPDEWPTSGIDGLEGHYATSLEASRYVMPRGEPWAPSGEGGSRWGQGSGGRAPALDETWYVCMYWRNRPDRGTRMILYNPANGRAVVAAAGYETGPGSATAVAGATEEVHHYLGTVHRSELMVGFAVDQTLPFGPISCTDGP